MPEPELQGCRMLVTGSSGRIGAAVAAAAHRAGALVRGVDLRPGPWTTHCGDLRDERVRMRVVAEVDVVVHTAALHAPHVGQRDDREFHEINVAVTEALLELVRQRGGHRFVFTSSTSVYGHALLGRRAAVWVDERVVAQPRDVYDVTKLRAEEGVLDQHRHGLSTVVLRVARCFPEPLARSAVHRLHRGVALDDVVRAHVLAAGCSRGGAVVNIAGPVVFRRCDTTALWTRAPAVLAERAPQVAGLFAARGWEVPARLDRVYDSAAATRLLGYVPRYGVPEMLAPELTGPFSG